MLLLKTHPVKLTFLQDAAKMRLFVLPSSRELLKVTELENCISIKALLGAITVFDNNVTRFTVTMFKPDKWSPEVLKLVMSSPTRFRDITPAYRDLILNSPAVEPSPRIVAWLEDELLVIEIRMSHVDS